MRELVVLYGSVDGSMHELIQSGGDASFPSELGNMLFVRAVGDEAAHEFFKRIKSGPDEGMHLFRCHMFHEAVERFALKSGQIPKAKELKISTDDLMAFNDALQGPIEWLI